MKCRNNIWVQVRWCLNIFACIIIGGLFTYAVSNDNFGLSLFCFALVACILVICFFRKSWIVFGVCSLAVALSCLVYNVTFDNYNSGYIETGRYTIEGRVSDVVNGNDTYRSVLLEDVTIHIDDNDLTGQKLMLSLSEIELEVGDYIVFNANVEFLQLTVYNNFNSLYVPKGIKYKCGLYTESNIISQENSGMTFDEQFRSSVQDILLDNISDFECATLAYAVLFGDKYLVDDTIIESFRYSGLAHVLAVSGLHTGVLFVLIMFLVGMLHMNRYVKLGIFAIFLFAFAWLCGFSPSICRAGIMCFVVAVSKLLGFKYDLLNSLGLAGIIILIINPLALFDVSFVLSFACIFSIALLTPLFTKCFSFIGNEKMSGLIAITLATQIGTLPFLAFYFGYVSVVGIFANVFLLPLFIATYSILFIALILCLVGIGQLLLGVVSVGLGFIIIWSKYLASIDYSILELGKISTVGVLCMVLILLIVSVKVMLKWRAKSVVCALLAIIFVISSFVGNTETSGSNSITSIRNVNESVLLTTNASQYSIVNPISGYSYLTEYRKFLRSYNINKIQNIIILDYKYYDFEKFAEFVSDFGVENILLSSLVADELTTALVRNGVESTIIFAMQHAEIYDIGVPLQYFEIDSDSCATNIVMNSQNLVIGSDETELGEIDIVKYYLDEDIDVLKWNDTADLEFIDATRVFGADFISNNDEITGITKSNFTFRI